MQVFFRTFSTLRIVLCLGLVASLTTACGSRNSDGSGSIDAIGDFQYAISGSRVTLSVVFPALSLDVGARIPVPQMKDSFIELTPDFQSGGLLLVTAVAKGSGDNAVSGALFLFPIEGSDSEANII